MNLRITPIVQQLIILNIVVYVGLNLFVVQSNQGRQIANDYFKLHKSNILGFRETVDVGFTKMYLPGYYQDQFNSDDSFRREAKQYYSDGRLSGPAKFKPVQIITWFFNHGGIMHLLFNMVALFFIGPAVEMILGSRRFLKFYLFCGILGGFLVTFFDPSSVPVLGASGAIFGVMVAFALNYPEEKFYFYFLIPIKAKWFVLGIGTISAVLVLVDIAGIERAADSISHFGHLSGMAAAFIYYKIQKYIPFLD